MPLFRYIALNSLGKKQKGTIEALHLQEGKERLRKQGMILLKLVPESKISINLKTKDLSGDHLVAFTSQLSELMKAQIPLYESLLSLEEMYQGERFYFIIHSLVEEIRKGGSLSAALAQCPRSFSPLYVSLVRAGEATGALDATFAKLSELLIKQNQLRKKLTTSLLYPALLLAFSFFVIMTMMIYVIPSIQAVFEEREVNGLTKVIFFLSSFSRTMWPYYLPLLVIISSISAVYIRKKKTLLKQKFFCLPFVKKMMIESAMARFCRTLSALLKGGVGMKEALSLARAVISFPLVESVIEKAENNIIEGSSLSYELKKSPLIPPLIARMVSIGEEGGNMGVMLEKSAFFFEEEVDKKLTRLMAISGPLILLIMGFFIGLIMMAILLPLTDASHFIH